MPWWAALLIAVGSGLFGLAFRAGFEEWRDFHGARRVVAGELARCAAGLRAIEREEAAHVRLPTALSTEAYRETRLVLGRYLPDPVWTSLEDVYQRLLALETTGEPPEKAEVRDLWRQADAAADQLRRYRPLVWPWR